MRVQGAAALTRRRCEHVLDAVLALGHRRRLVLHLSHGHHVALQLCGATGPEAQPGRGWSPAAWAQLERKARGMQGGVRMRDAPATALFGQLALLGCSVLAPLLTLDHKVGKVAQQAAVRGGRGRLR